MVFFYFTNFIVICVISFCLIFSFTNQRCIFISFCKQIRYVKNLHIFINLNLACLVADRLEYRRDRSVIKSNSTQKRRVKVMWCVCVCVFRIIFSLPTEFSFSIFIIQFETICLACANACQTLIKIQ